MPDNNDFRSNILTVICFLLVLPAMAQQSKRQVISINDNWAFAKDTASWQPVSLPHSWNINDVMDDEPGYYRAPCWYKKIIPVNAAWKKKQVCLFFEGANQQTTVYVNGQVAGQHTGGYTAFYIPVTALLKFDGKDNNNEILVRVDNSYNADIPPLTADFSFFGGIYRDLYIVATDAVHFSTREYGSPAVYITTPTVNAASAQLQVRSVVSNELKADRKLSVLTTVFDREGTKINEVTSNIVGKAGLENSCTQTLPSFATPHLWTPEDPYLYSVVTQITDRTTKELLDETRQPVGLRWFSFDAANGFLLNGLPYKLIGTSRHQDYYGKANAVPDELAREDVALLKKMGGNFLRVAHYPQDPAILEACDKLGILASVEIPLVNEITESPAFYTNCMQMQVEMIRQQYNHPSVIIWCYMNEILLRPHFTNDAARQKIYFASITRLATMLDSITRKEDPTRYTMIANHGDFDKYNNNGLTTIPMIVGWNLYSGWYGGTLNDFPKFLDKHHTALPTVPFMVTEYGADADPRIRSFNPVRFDKSVEYATAYHQFYLQEIQKRPFVAGAMAWNLADFNSETREETMPHINNKGLLTWNRTPKDPYYLYQALLLKQPFIRILAAGWKIRSGVADSNALVCYQPLQVTANVDTVELFVNSNSLGKKKIDKGLGEWLVPFVNGRNMIEARGVKDNRIYADNYTVQFTVQPYLLKDTRLPFKAINILSGATRYFIDEDRQQLWLPDQPYHAGGWGFIGGKAFKAAGNGRLPYGTDKNITGTDNDPVYQTQQVGISEYRLDVGPGEYELTLHFAELAGTKAKELAYNLYNNANAGDSALRIFDVYVNDALMLEHFNPASQYGSAQAIEKKMKLLVNDEKGIRIIFKAIAGEPVLNALQLRKMY